MSKHELVSMRLSKKEKNEEVVEEGNGPEFPYGLSLHIDSEAFTKLGISMPDAGSSVMIEAVANVEKVSIEADGEGKEKSMKLQITDLAIVSKDKEKSDKELFFNDNS